MPLERQYPNIFTVFPKTPQTPAEYHKLFKEAKMALFTEEKIGATQDEILFMSFVKRLSQIFDKAGSMLAEERFTVHFHGNIEQPFKDLAEYEIVPLIDGELNDKKPS